VRDRGVTQVLDAADERPNESSRRSGGVNEPGSKLVPNTQPAHPQGTSGKSLTYETTSRSVTDGEKGLANDACQMGCSLPASAEAVRKFVYKFRTQFRRSVAERAPKGLSVNALREVDFRRP
jgi:hypothetical protein